MVSTLMSAACLSSAALFTRKFFDASLPIFPQTSPLLF